MRTDRDPAAAAAAPRVVLDTNVALALYVFRDVRLAGLRAALDASAFEPVADDETLAEFERVLRYPAVKCGEATAAAAADAYAARCTRIPAASRVLDNLPRCRDPDDQKFLLLAQRAGAAWLLTRDKALLRLRKGVRFRIAQPEALADAPVPGSALAPVATRNGVARSGA